MLKKLQRKLAKKTWFKIDEKKYSKKYKREVDVKVPSKNYIKLKNKIAKIEDKIAKKREYNTHQISSYVSKNEKFDTIVIEDLNVKGIKWELKSPLGDGKNTIKNDLHTARKQSTNVIIDLRRIKMHQIKALSNINHYFTSHRSKICHLIVITKSEEILEIF